MFTNATVTGGRLTESGVVFDAKSGAPAAYRGENVQITVHDNGSFTLSDTSLPEGYCFSLTWDFVDMVNSSCFEQGASATDAESKVAYFATPMLDEYGQVTGIRVDCLERLWFWLEIDISFD